MAFFNCLTCKKVMPLIESSGKRCPSCGGVNGETLSRERFDEGLKAGVFFNIDPRTGKRAKRKRR